MILVVTFLFVTMLLACAVVGLLADIHRTLTDIYRTNAMTHDKVSGIARDIEAICLSLDRIRREGGGQDA